MLVVKYYRNNRNFNKYLKVHYYGCNHRTVRQFMMWGNGVVNFFR